MSSPNSTDRRVCAMCGHPLRRGEPAVRTGGDLIAHRGCATYTPRRRGDTHGGDGRARTRRLVEGARKALRSLDPR